MANYISKRGANVAPSYATTDDLPASTEVGDLVFVGGQLGIAVSASGYQTCDKTDVVLPLDWTATTQQANLAISDASSGDEIGYSMAIDGDTLVVGARYQDTGGTNAGAAYVFTRSGTTWSQQAKLTASDAQSNNNFGFSVSIDGDTVAVLASNADAATSAIAAYVFTRSGTSWSQQAKLVPSSAQSLDYFPAKISISSDTVIVGGWGKNSAAANVSAVYVFTRSGTSWSQQAVLTASDEQAYDGFGRGVGISSDTVVVGAGYEDTGGTNVGAAYVFTRSGTSWSQQAKIQASDAQANDFFGYSVSIDGDTMVVGGYSEDTGGSNAGAAYVFTRSGTSWSQQAKVTASDAQAHDNFGFSVSIDGDTIVAAAPEEDTEGSNAGAAYVFTRSGTTWTEAKKIVASDAQQNGKFGFSVDISSNTLVVGAHKSWWENNTGKAYTFIAG